MRKFSDDDQALFDCVEVEVRRPLPRKSILCKPEFKDAVTVLKKAIEEHGVETDSPTKYPGLEQVYKLGWLQTEALDDDLIIYSFPSLLHHRYETPRLLIIQIADATYLSYAERLLYPDSYDGIEFATVKDLCFAAIPLFSHTLLQHHSRKSHVAPILSNAPEAQFADELYRCLYKVTGGECTIHSEFSYTLEGRVDFFLKGKRWAIETLKEGNDALGHINRFTTQGAYERWGIVSQFILLDFRLSAPRSKRSMPSRSSLLESVQRVFAHCHATQ